MTKKILFRLFKKLTSYRDFLYSLWYRFLLDTEGDLNVTYPFFVNDIGGLKIGKRCTIKGYSRIECFCRHNEVLEKKIVIGDNVEINWFVHIGAFNKIIIEDGVLIGSHVLIIDHNHGDAKDITNAPNERTLVSKGVVHICKNVWIGENCCILPNVTIGCNSIVGAGTIVTHDIPANSLVVGNPAKIVKNLNSLPL